MLHLLCAAWCGDAGVGDSPLALVVSWVEDLAEVLAELPACAGADEPHEDGDESQRPQLTASSESDVVLVVAVAVLAEADVAAGVDPLHADGAEPECVTQLVEVLGAVSLHHPGEVLPPPARCVGGRAPLNAACGVGADEVHEDGAVERDALRELLVAQLRCQSL